MVLQWVSKQWNHNFHTGLPGSVLKLEEFLVLLQFDISCFVDINGRPVLSLTEIKEERIGGKRDREGVEWEEGGEIITRM